MVYAMFIAFPQWKKSAKYAMKFIDGILSM